MNNRKHWLDGHNLFCKPFQQCCFLRKVSSHRGNEEQCATSEVMWTRFGGWLWLPWSVETALSPNYSLWGPEVDSQSTLCIKTGRGVIKDVHERSRKHGDYQGHDLSDSASPCSPDKLEQGVLFCVQDLVSEKRVQRGSSARDRCPNACSV